MPISFRNMLDSTRTRILVAASVLIGLSIYLYTRPRKNGASGAHTGPYDRSRYSQRSLHKVDLPDGYYNATLEVYDLTISKADGTTVTTKLDTGIRFPYPLHRKAQVIDGYAYVLAENQ